MEPYPAPEPSDTKPVRGEGSFLQRSAEARWFLAVPLLLFGLLLLAASLASGFLSLPFGALFTSTAVWLMTGAKDPPPRRIGMAMAISAALTALMLLTGIVLWLNHVL